MKRREGKVGRADLVGLQIHTYLQKFCFPMPGNGQGQARSSAGEKDLEKLVVQGPSEPEVTGAAQGRSCTLGCPALLLA